MKEDVDLCGHPRSKSRLRGKKKFTNTGAQAGATESGRGQSWRKKRARKTGKSFVAAGPFKFYVVSGTSICWGERVEKSG